MVETTRRGAAEGLGLGIVAGIIFAIVEVIAAALMGNPGIMPFRMFASVVLGETAMQASSAGTVFVVGAIVHLVLSAGFGLVHGLLGSRLVAASRTSFARQAAFGIAFGLILYVVNFQIIARIFYPWFLMAPQFLQAVLHAVFFGLPLGLMYAAGEHRAERRVGVWSGGTRVPR